MAYQLGGYSMKEMLKFNLPVDIFLGNHPVDNQTIEKRQYMLEHPGENPFIDPDAFRNKMDTVAANLQKIIDSGE